MIKVIKKAVWRILNFTPLGPSLQLYLRSALKENGWYLSFKSKSSVDASGKPLAWFTYSFLTFLEPRLGPSFKVFEFGMGNSTLWFGPKIQKIVSIDHHKGWFEKVKSNMPKNASVNLVEDEIAYAKYLKNPNFKGHFDLIIVDGIKRVECMQNCLEALSPTGVIILDNSERSEYDEGKKFLMENGYKELPFWGMIPIDSAYSCTSVFYRQENILNI